MSARDRNQRNGRNKRKQGKAKSQEAGNRSVWLLSTEKLQRPARSSLPEVQGTMVAEVITLVSLKA